MRAVSTRAPTGRLMVLSCLAAVLPGVLPFAAVRPVIRPAVARPAVRMVAPAEEAPPADDVDAALDALVRAEVEACFAGMEEALASGDEQKALALIQTQGKQVLSNVLSQLEDEGQLLSSQLSSRVEELATDQRTEMLKKYDAQCVPCPCRTPAHFACLLSRN